MGRTLLQTKHLSQLTLCNGSGANLTEFYMVKYFVSKSGPNGKILNPKCSENAKIRTFSTVLEKIPTLSKTVYMWLSFKENKQSLRKLTTFIVSYQFRISFQLKHWTKDWLVQILLRSRTTRNMNNMEKPCERAKGSERANVLQIVKESFRQKYQSHRAGKGFKTFLLFCCVKILLQPGRSHSAAMEPQCNHEQTEGSLNHLNLENLFYLLLNCKAWKM